MSSYIIERCRSLSEETEVLKKMIVILFSKLPRDSITSLIIETAIKRLAIQIQNNSEEILSIYLDKSGDRKKEISYLGGNKSINKNDNQLNDKQYIWTNFYNSIKSVTSADSKIIDLTYSNSIDMTKQKMEDLLINTLKNVELKSIFIPEEDLGRRLYLELYYNRFINLKKLRNYRETKYINEEIERLRRKGKIIDDNKDIRIIFEEIDLNTYLKTYDKFSDIPRYFKYKDKDYEEYISDLLEYLRNFFFRSHPLLDENNVEKELNKDFEQDWNKGFINDWRIHTNEMLYYSKPFDRLFFSEGTYNSHIKSKHYKREEDKYLLLTDIERENMKIKSINYDKNICKKEFLINKYSQLLSIQRREAIDYINKLQSSTNEELELDKKLENDENGIKCLIDELKDLNYNNDNNNLNSISDSESDDIDELQDKVYNPLKLPLGPDGRPMPYWLFKLNGLGIEFKCEICGNCSYWGRRAFERHFQESKHANGLSALGIPNTCHFKEITKISDAQDLYLTLCKQVKESSFDEQNNLEMEDSEGNVLPLKSFQDLYRQGLI